MPTTPLLNYFMNFFVRATLFLSLSCLSLSAAERVRIMAANTTSNNFSAYEDPGIRIFQGLDPDIVLVQEFNYRSGSLRDLVDTAFGEAFYFSVEAGNEQIPNGIISRYPILESGEWEDVEVDNRDFAWARIDIPGDTDLWAVSVHFLTRNSTVRNAQAQALVSFIQANVPSDVYLVVGGDFNTDNFGEPGLNTLSAIVDTDGRPDDQFGTRGTNASREKPYDQVLPDAALVAVEVPVAISGHSFTYSEGLVFDSRVFTPISAVSPVLSGDSGAPSMQHMAVIRDFLIPADGPGGEPVDPVETLDTPALIGAFYTYANGFTAAWLPVEGATGYRLDVALSDQFASGDADLFFEDFDLDTSVPSGWTNGGSGFSNLDTHYSSAPYARAMAAGDSLTSPSFNFPEELSFFVESSGGGNGQTGSVSYSIDGAGWQLLESFVVSQSGDAVFVDLTADPDLTISADVRFRFESSFNTWYLDDVSVATVSQAGFAVGYEDLAVGDRTHFSVNGLDASTTYYYRVRAEDATMTSESSATGSTQTNLFSSALAAWSADEGISPLSSTSDADMDSILDQAEFAFGTDPNDPTSGADLLVAEPTESGFRVTVRQSTAPNLEFTYFGSEVLSDFGASLSEGVSVDQYSVISREGFGDYELVTLEIDTGSADQYFFIAEADSSDF
jgi:hypothetical protein